MRALSRRLSTAVAAVVLLTAVVTSPVQADTPALPANFLWGVASSGFQSEGSPGGHPASNWTVVKPDNVAVGRSVDFRHRYRSDIALAQGLGVGVYRVGVEWARVQPTPNGFDQGELAYYDDMIGAIAAAGMRPMITLDHWVYPQWVMRAGGWTSPSATQRWMTYAREIVRRYAKYNPMWVTFNEPVMNLLQQVSRGEMPAADAPTAVDRMVSAHDQISGVIHRTQPGAMVTSNSAYLPLGGEPLIDPALTDRFVRTSDFVGIDNYYGFSLGNPLAGSAALTGGNLSLVKAMPSLPVDADSIYYALRYNHRRYPGKPLYIVESGMPTADGAPRADGYRRGDHLADTVYWVQRARADGIPVIGYNYWSLTDNYEWGTYHTRFGLYRVDVETDPSLTRTPTDAVAVYRQITAADGVGPHYRPTRPAAVCSVVDPPSSCTEPVH
ncbi:MAG: family 1 glycosylhydrolase [Gordonia sp. (in: high G+C Gram-positive bacteria)]|uniref:family 1 glycosylhydrolase n=1 Tax=Gordonia sp. (in: high G+C Gram-positive bacteria) TaxID=84139 RepID=UPI0039E58211